MTRVIILPGGRRTTLGKYAAAWKQLKAVSPDTEVTGWEWYPVPAWYILRGMRRGLQDRINQRGGLQMREASSARIQRQLARRIRHHCRWCGQPLGRYAPAHDRFCDVGCRRAHF